MSHERDGWTRTVIGMSSLSTIEQLQRLPARTVLFREGDAPRGAYLIHSGEVELAFAGRNGVQKTLRVAEAGEYVGLGDVVAGRKHDCTATARTPVTAGFVPMVDLATLLNETPSLWLTIAENLSAGVSSCWQSMRRLGSAAR